MNCWTLDESKLYSRSRNREQTLVPVRDVYLWDQVICNQTISGLIFSVYRLFQRAAFEYLCPYMPPAHFKYIKQQNNKISMLRMRDVISHID
jgi:hypothetical protein